METSKRVLQKPTERYYGYHVDGYPVEGPEVRGLDGNRWGIVDDKDRIREIDRNTLIYVRGRK